MSDKSLFKLGEIYGGILNGVSVVQEKTLSKKNEKLGTKPGKGAVELNDKKAAHLGNEDTSGPENADNFTKAEIDTKNKKVTDDNIYNIKNLSYGEEDEENIEKNVKATINNFMANKSIFDKLFESVMNEETDELQELGINTDASAPAGDETAELGEGEVTITLDKETAQKLHDVLMSVLTSETEPAEGEDLGEDLGEDEEGDGSVDEDEENLGGAKPLSSKVDTGKNNKVGTANVQPGKGHGGSADYTDEVGNADELGHALVNAKKVNVGTNNKVQGQTKTGKVGSSAFAPK